MRQRDNWEGADSDQDAWLLSIKQYANKIGFPTKSLYVCFQTGKRKCYLYITKRIYKVFAISTNKRGEVRLH